MEYFVDEKARISIHALRVEGDPTACCVAYFSRNFYPRPPGGGRPEKCDKKRRKPYFYPRPPGGGRPRSYSGLRRPGSNFYPRPPGGGRRDNAEQERQTAEFLSTPSGWRATRQDLLRLAIELISIHALRVEGDPAFRFISIYRP